MPRSPRPILLALLLVVAGCGPRFTEEPVHTTDQVRVVLRQMLEGGEPVARGYNHPATIADVRLAHILGSLNYETRKGQRRPVFRTTHLYEISEGLAKALQKADPDAEVAAAAFGRDRRILIFAEDRVTSFRAWVRGDQLYLEFYAVEELLQEAGTINEAEKYRIPTTTPSGKPRFRMVAGSAIVLAGPQSVAIDWRNPEFRRPAGLGGGGSRLGRKTILMEAPAEEEPPVAPTPEGFSDAQLQALDELEGTRRAGLITEVEFQRRRILILEGKLEEAGYGAESR
jgi:hypothetical protein